MHWKSFTPLIASLLLTAPAWAGTTILQRGTPAPEDGILFDDEAARQVVEDLRDNQNRASQLESLKAENEVLRLQVQDLEAAVVAKDRALELAEQREKLHEEIETKMKAALEMNERAMKLATEAAEVSIKAAQASTAALEKMQDKIDRANRRGFWGTIAGIISGLLGGIALAP